MVARRCWLVATVALLPGGAYAGDHRADKGAGPSYSKEGELVGAHFSQVITMSGSGAYQTDEHGHAGDKTPRPWSIQLQLGLDGPFKRVTLAGGPRATFALAPDHKAFFFWHGFAGVALAKSDLERGLFVGTGVGLDVFPWQKHGLRVQVDYTFPKAGAPDDQFRISLAFVWKKLTTPPQPRQPSH